MRQTDGEVLYRSHLMVGFHLAAQVGDVDARHRIFRFAVENGSLHTILRQLVQPDIHLGNDVEVPRIKESTLRLSCVLTRPMVVCYPADAVQMHHGAVFRLYNVQHANAQLVVYRSLLAVGHPFRLQLPHLNIQVSVFSFLIQ